MIWLSLDEVFEIHTVAISISGGSSGLRDRNGLESALGQPMQTFGGVDLYLSLIEKAAALCYFLVCNHPFVDGNKRVGHAAMEIVLLQNGYEIFADIRDQESVVLALAAGELSLEAFTNWVEQNVIPFNASSVVN
jgi:death-on-curing protein